MSQYDFLSTPPLPSRHPLQFGDDFEFRAYLESMCHPHEELTMGPYDPKYPMDTLTVKRRVAGLKRQSVKAQRTLLLHNTRDRYHVYLLALEEILAEIRQHLPVEQRPIFQGSEPDPRRWPLRPEGT